MSSGVFSGVALIDGSSCAALSRWLAKVLSSMDDAPPEALDGLRCIAKAAQLHEAANVHVRAPEPEGVSVVEAAELRGVTPGAVTKRLRAGSLPGWKVDGRWVVDAGTVE